MNVLVTGGGGFIGSALVSRLLELNHQVTSFSRCDYPELRQIGVKTLKGDLTDLNDVKIACAKKDIVFHVAAKAGICGPYKNYYQTNVLGTKNIIKACSVEKVKYLIFTSSASVVFAGKNLEGADESLSYPAKPLSNYTATKALAEQAVLAANSPELSTLSLRPHLVWGPEDRHIIPRIIQRAQSGKLRMIGSGQHLIDTTYIDNCVSAHICAAAALKNNPDAAGKVYFISNGEPIPVREFIKNILKSANLAPVKSTLSFTPAIIAAGLLEMAHKLLRIKTEPQLTRFLVRELCTSHWFDISAAREKLGFVPEVSIKSGFDQLAKSFPESVKNVIIKRGE